MSLPITDAERKALPILTFFANYFPDVWAELVRVCVAGNIQHNPERAPTDIVWSRDKSADQLNTAFRHLFDRACGVRRDVDGQYHLAKSIWRECAQLQLDIEAERAAVATAQVEAARADAVRNAIADQRPDWAAEGPRDPHGVPYKTPPVLPAAPHLMPD